MAAQPGADYADLDLIVCTSISEGTPVALLEAMAAGKAVVSADVGGVRDLMTGLPTLSEGMEFFQNGILVKRDPSLLAGAIRNLLADPDRARAMGRAGREFVRERFSQHRLADELERIYLSLARAKGLLPLADDSAIAQPESESLLSTIEDLGQLAPPSGAAEAGRDGWFKHTTA